MACTIYRPEIAMIGDPSICKSPSGMPSQALVSGGVQPIVSSWDVVAQPPGSTKPQPYQTGNTDNAREVKGCCCRTFHCPKGHRVENRDLDTHYDWHWLLIAIVIVVNIELFVLESEDFLIQAHQQFLYCRLVF